MVEITEAGVVAALRCCGFKSYQRLSDHFGRDPATCEALADTLDAMAAKGVVSWTGDLVVLLGEPAAAIPKYQRIGALVIPAGKVAKEVAARKQGHNRYDTVNRTVCSRPAKAARRNKNRKG